jgi:hypothetical protein
MSLTDPFNPLPRGIGQFIIGESAIGTPPFDWMQTVISQYGNSYNLLNIIDAFSQSVDMTENIDNWYDDVWNVQTAQGYGLDVWGRIVGVSRILPVTTKYFGFEEAGFSSADPFNVSPFYTGEPITSNYSLSDDAFRQLIYAKAAANIWDGSIGGLNFILRTLFPGKVCYVTDGQNMTMQYVFDFALTPVQISIVFAIGILPKPTGVLTSVVQNS